MIYLKLTKNTDCKTLKSPLFFMQAIYHLTIFIDLRGKLLINQFYFQNDANFGGQHTT